MFQIVVLEIPGLVQQFSFQIVFFGPDFAVGGQIVANHRRRIQRCVIQTRNRIVHIHGTFGGQDDGAFVSVGFKRLFQIGHERVLLSAFFRYITGEFDALATKDEEGNRHTANPGHFDITGDDVDFVHQVVNEVAILNTVFGDPGAIRGRSFGQSENVLGRYIVFGHAPFDGF